MRHNRTGKNGGKQPLASGVGGDRVFQCNVCRSEVTLRRGKGSVVCLGCGQQFEEHGSKESAEARRRSQPSTKPKEIIELGKTSFVLSYRFSPVRRYDVTDLRDLLDEQVICMIQGGLVDRFNQPSAIYVKADQSGEIVRIPPNNPTKGYSRFCLEIWKQGYRKRCLESSFNAIREIFQEPLPSARWSNGACWLGLTAFFVPLVLFDKTIAVMEIGQVTLRGQEGADILRKNIEKMAAELSARSKDFVNLALDENILRCMSSEEAQEFLERCQQAGGEILRLAEKTYVTERKLREQEFVDELTSLFDVVHDEDSLRRICGQVVTRTVRFLGMKHGVLLMKKEASPSQLSVFCRSESLRGQDLDEATFSLAQEDERILGDRRPFVPDQREAPPICELMHAALGREEAALSCLLPLRLGLEKMAVFCILGEALDNSGHSNERVSPQDLEFLERLLHELEMQMGRSFATVGLTQILQERDEYISHTSHILGSQMHRILGRTHFLRKVCSLVPGQEQIVTLSEKIDEEVKRMNHRTKTLLHFMSVGKEGYSYRLDKKSSLLLLLENLKSQFFYVAQARGITIDIIPPASFPSTYFDESAMEIALANLIDNAVKYSHSNRLIEMTISHDRTGQRTHIEISDFGIGVPEDELQRIFDPHFRGKWQDPKRFIHGTGIGLAVAKNIIEVHGGRIWCESHRGKNWTTPSDSPEGFKVTFFIEIPDMRREPK